MGLIVNGKPWIGGCLAAGVVAAGAAWFTVAIPEAGTAHAVCGPDLSRDDVVAAKSKGVAVVEAVENVRYREDGGSAYLTTRVKVLEPLKDRFGDVLAISQGVKNGGAPGRYATEDPDRYRSWNPAGGTSSRSSPDRRPAAREPRRGRGTPGRRRGAWPGRVRIGRRPWPVHLRLPWTAAVRTCTQADAGIPDGPVQEDVLSSV
ncbi:hypothetical protein ACIP46_17105 [Streptomyces lavendulae]|uniref:hypothetical protein n=1 Tax=Streptomyces lavendulae TaxID=1914 RepID=UPI00381F7DB6